MSVRSFSQTEKLRKPQKISHLEICETILKKKNWRYIGEWLHDSTQEQRLGLRMVYSIVLNKGERRFKKKETLNMSHDSRPSTRDWESAASEFRRSFYSTAYERSFGGDSEKKYRETEVYLLGKQEFTKTFIAQVLEQKVSEMIEKWLALEITEDYKNLVLGTVRSLYTRCRNHQFTKSEGKDCYGIPRKTMMAKAPRFDKLKTSVEFEAKQKNYNKLGVRLSSSRSQYRPHSTSRSTRPSYSASSIIGSPSLLKQRFLNGNGRVIDFLGNVKERQLPSLYRDSFRGQTIRNKVFRRTDQDFFSRTFSGPHVSPDPPTIYYDREKIDRYTAHLGKTWRGE